MGTHQSTLVEHWTAVIGVLQVFLIHGIKSCTRFCSRISSFCQLSKISTNKKRKTLHYIYSFICSRVLYNINDTKLEFRYEKRLTCLLKCNFCISKPIFTFVSLCRLWASRWTCALRMDDQMPCTPLGG